jgi:hypothetical protein
MRRKTCSSLTTMGALALVSSTACTVHQQSAEVTAPTPQVVRAEAPPNLADAAAGCELVQTRKDIPVGCTTDNIDGVLSMIMTFATGDDVEKYSSPLATYVAKPFCDAANARGRQARVYITLLPRAVRYFDCELSRWTDWFDLPADVAPAATAAASEASNATRAMEACERVQQDAGIPIGCSTQYSNGMTTMTIKFGDVSNADDLVTPMVESVAAPFCRGANQVNRAALVYFLFMHARRGRAFNCEADGWGEWFELRGDPSDRAPAASATDQATL